MKNHSTVTLRCEDCKRKFDVITMRPEIVRKLRKLCDECKRKRVKIYKQHTEERKAHEKTICGSQR